MVQLDVEAVVLYEETLEMGGHILRRDALRVSALLVDKDAAHTPDT